MNSQFLLGIIKKYWYNENFIQVGIVILNYSISINISLSLLFITRCKFIIINAEDLTSIKDKSQIIIHKNKQYYRLSLRMLPIIIS